VGDELAGRVGLRLGKERETDAARLHDRVLEARRRRAVGLETLSDEAALLLVSAWCSRKTSARLSSLASPGASRSWGKACSSLECASVRT